MSDLWILHACHAGLPSLHPLPPGELTLQCWSSPPENHPAQTETESKCTPFCCCCIIAEKYSAQCLYLLDAKSWSLWAKLGRHTNWDYSKMTASISKGEGEGWRREGTERGDGVWRKEGMWRKKGRFRNHIQSGQTTLRHIYTSVIHKDSPNPLSMHTQDPLCTVVKLFKPLTCFCYKDVNWTHNGYQALCTGCTLDSDRERERNVLSNCMSTTHMQ